MLNYNQEPMKQPIITTSTMQPIQYEHPERMTTKMPLEEIRRLISESKKATLAKGWAKKKRRRTKEKSNG